MADLGYTDPGIGVHWDVTFTNMFGTELPIAKIIDHISVYESIYQETIFGHVVLNDNIGFIETNQLIGQGVEKFKLSMHTNVESEDSSNFEKEFRINAYHDADFKDDGKSGCRAIMDIVSPMLFKNNRTRISRSFNSMTASEIVDYISYEIMDFGSGMWDDLQSNEKSIYAKNIVVPNWSPFKLLKFLCQNTISDTQSSNYLFFENNTGFHFTTIDALKNQDTSVDINVSEIQQDFLTKSEKGVITISNNYARKYQESKRFNHSESMLNGLYGGTLYTHNILKKEYNTYEALYDSDEFILGDAGLDGDGQIGKKAESHLGFMPDEYLYSIHDKKDKSHYIHRDMKIAELRTNIIKFDIPGNSSIWAGDIINLNKDTKVLGSDEPYDLMMSGKWLVTAIHHRISEEHGYYMTLECMKDSFENIPEEPDTE